ncbi:MAG: hypothetical protein M3096_10265 [Actinomycetia bacterium]|nr:hypothetical protein [Actinomycetes bacterium]
MNERNQELIIDLLGGRLSPNEERRALTRIENEPDLRAEYEAQISAISILNASGTPMMTADERTALHASLRRQLHLEDASVAVVAAPSRWQRWWAPIGGLAIAAAVFVGAVVVLPGALSENDSDGTFEMAAAAITTTAASSSQADDLASVSGDEGTGGNDAGAAAPEATESAPEEESLADAETQSVDTYEAATAAPALPYLTDVDLGSLENDLASDPDSLRSISSPSSSKSTEFDTEAVDTCLESLRVLDPSSEIFPVALTTYDDTASLVVSVSPSAGDGFLAVYSVALCLQLASTQG